MADLERNKRNVMAFYEMAFTAGKPREAVERYVGDIYRQHNPHVGDGVEPFIAYFERMAVEHPGKSIRFLRSLAEDDLVMVHTHQIWPDDEDYVTMDVFRLDEHGKIVEHWDVMQTVPADQAHDNSMF